MAGLALCQCDALGDGEFWCHNPATAEDLLCDHCRPGCVLNCGLANTGSGWVHVTIRRFGYSFDAESFGSDFPPSTRSS